MRFSSVAEANDYIESFASRYHSRQAALPPRERQAARLPQMHALLDRLGNPERQVRVAHVTGTSGKGSTATILAAIARASGMHVGLYVNPYVVTPQERVQIDGCYIADAPFIACTEQVAAAVDQLQTARGDDPPHLKQIWVALALLAFAQAQVDMAVVEVGMGGRFDETSVVRTAVSVITTVGFDHMEYLGHTLTAIAWHKAGIIRNGAPAVTGVSGGEALAVLRAEAEHERTTLDVLGEAFSVATREMSATQTRFDYRDDHYTLDDLAIPLAGAYQAVNSAMAIRAAAAVIPQLTPDAIRAGLAQVWLPGRFEVAARSPTIILDVAHNPEKMRALVQTLRATTHWDRLILLVGVLDSKELGSMLAEWQALAPLIVATAPTVAGRVAQTAQHIVTIAQDLGFDGVAPGDPAAALRYVKSIATPDDIIVITGSLFLVSQVRRML